MSSLVGPCNGHLWLIDFRIYGKIHYNYTEFTFKQIHHSNITNKINAKYVFPIISDMQLSKLSITKNNKLSTIRLRELQIPIKSYEDAVNAGEKPYILKILQDTNISTYNITNINENTEIIIEATYVCKAEQTLSEDYWKLKIPKALFPLKLKEAPHSAEFHIFQTNLNEENSFILENGNLITLDQAHNVAIFQNFDVNNDIELVYYFKSPQIPFLIVQKDLRINRYAFHLSCPADPTLLEISQEMQAGEYIIFLDRCHSMDDWVKTITEAAALFIRSLPEDCYFNIIRFGERLNEYLKPVRNMINLQLTKHAVLFFSAKLI